jgi:hypothetical protein
MGIIDSFHEVGIDVVNLDLFAGHRVCYLPALAGIPVGVILVLLNALVLSVGLQFGIYLGISVLLLTIKGRYELLDVRNSILARVVAGNMLFLRRHGGGKTML